MAVNVTPVRSHRNNSSGFGFSLFLVNLKGCYLLSMQFLEFSFVPAVVKLAMRRKCAIFSPTQNYSSLYI